jgi:hypothetical protein
MAPCLADVSAVRCRVRSSILTCNVGCNCPERQSKTQRTGSDAIGVVDSSRSLTTYRKISIGNAHTITDKLTHTVGVGMQKGAMGQLYGFGSGFGEGLDEEAKP